MPADDNQSDDANLSVAKENGSGSIESKSSTHESTSQPIPSEVMMPLPTHVVRKVEACRIQFVEDVKRLLIHSLPDDVRKAMTMEDIPSLTRSSLERASTWHELDGVCNDATNRLVEFAARYVPEKDRLGWIELRLEDWEAEIVGKAGLVTRPGLSGTRSIVELACLVLRARREIGTESSRKILKDKLRKSFEAAKCQAELKLNDATSSKSGTQLRFDSFVEQAQIRLGKQAAQCDQDLRIMTKGGRGSEQQLRQKFPELEIWRTIDEATSLSQISRDRFFEVSLRAHQQLERFRFIGEMLGLPGSTLYDYYKRYRKKHGLQRTRSPKRCARQGHS